MAPKPTEIEGLEKAMHKALQRGDPMKILELAGDMVAIQERSGQITREDANKKRMELVTEMIKLTSTVPSREKVTLSLPDDVLKALRLASAETGDDMSDIVADALRAELQKFEHARQALRKL